MFKGQFGELIYKRNHSNKWYESILHPVDQNVKDANGPGSSCPKRVHSPWQKGKQQTDRPNKDGVQEYNYVHAEWFITGWIRGVVDGRGSRTNAKLSLQNQDLQHALHPIV